VRFEITSVKKQSDREIEMYEREKHKIKRCEEEKILHKANRVFFVDDLMAV
jgi:hypothetical protein